MASEWMKNATFEATGSDSNPAWPFADGSYPENSWDIIPEEMSGCDVGCGDCSCCGYLLGAAVLGGLMGMAEAIRANDRLWLYRCAFCPALVTLNDGHECGHETSEQATGHCDFHD
jgi:hypothetical protein